MLPCLEGQGARVKFFNGGPFWPEEVAGRGAGSGLKVKGSAVMQGQSHGLTGLRAWRAALYGLPMASVQRQRLGKLWNWREEGSEVGNKQHFSHC